jgi:hypothetical protein
MPRANHPPSLRQCRTSTAALAALPTRSIAGGEIQKMTTLTPYLLFDGNCHQALFVFTWAEESHRS